MPVRVGNLAFRFGLQKGCSASKHSQSTLQPVEKVQRKLGFFACIRYNGSGGEKDAETRKNGSGCSGDRGDRQPGAKGASAAEDR